MNKAKNLSEAEFIKFVLLLILPGFVISTDSWNMLILSLTSWLRVSYYNIWIRKVMLVIQ
jgi:hypothetical protein